MAVCEEDGEHLTNFTFWGRPCAKHAGASMREKPRCLSSHTYLCPPSVCRSPPLPSSPPSQPHTQTAPMLVVLPRRRRQGLLPCLMLKMP